MYISAICLCISKIWVECGRIHFDKFLPSCDRLENAFESNLICNRTWISSYIRFSVLCSVSSTFSGLSSYSFRKPAISITIVLCSIQCFHFLMYQHFVSGSTCSESIPEPEEDLTIGQKLLKEPIWIGMIVILNLVFFFCVSYVIRRKCGKKIAKMLPHLTKATNCNSKGKWVDKVNFRKKVYRQWKKRRFLRFFIVNWNLIRPKMALCHVL